MTSPWLAQVVEEDDASSRLGRPETIIAVASCAALGLLDAC